jgi:hypothetical protein
MQLLNRRCVTILACAAALGTAVLAAVSAGQAAAGLQTSNHVRLQVRLTGPSPQQQTGGLPGPPSGGTPGGPAGAAPVRRGVFTMTGALHDAGTVAFRMPSLGSPNHESLITLRGKRGSLRLAVSGGGGMTTGGASGQPHWRVAAGSGLYTAASGGGALSETPDTLTLSGVLTLRGR